MTAHSMARQDFARRETRPRRAREIDLHESAKTEYAVL